MKRTKIEIVRSKKGVDILINSNCLTGSKDTENGAILNSWYVDTKKLMTGISGTTDNKKTPMAKTVNGINMEIQIIDKCTGQEAAILSVEDTLVFMGHHPVKKTNIMRRALNKGFEVESKSHVFKPLKLKGTL